MNLPPKAFDLTMELSQGTTVLEASAGTGKTYAIVGLAARLIAEGTPIGRLLLVTFSRAATAELRERMRDRVRALIVELAQREVSHASGPRRRTESDPAPDPLLHTLGAGTPSEIALRRRRLERALSDFDSSTIATTHTFCNRMLEALGFLGEREMVYDIVENVDDLVEEAARDLYLIGFAGADRPEFGFDAAAKIAKDAVDAPSVTLSPTAEDLGDTDSDTAHAAARRVRFAQRVRMMVEERKRLGRLRTYDDLQAILHRLVTDPVIGEDVRRRIRNTFDVVLVDEFQDTDPQQWDILRHCFHGHRPLILVGDPKQSIYAFRGAEVLSYLSAVRSADELAMLDTNHRSDGDLVSALATIYEGATLGHSDIVVHPVESAHPGSRIEGRAPVRIRAFTRSGFTVLNNSGFPSAEQARTAIIADVAADIAELLTSDTTIEVDGVRRRVQPGDIAVLAKTNRTIGLLQRELAARSVAAVVGSGTSVFHTAGARHWLWVLRAIESPSRSDRVRLAARTPLIGWDEQFLAHVTDGAVADLGARLARWGQVLAEAGFAAMAENLMSSTGCAERVLAQTDGERALTDLLQVASLCNRHVVGSHTGITELVEWLSERVVDDSVRSRHAEQSRRLDRDAEAVQIMTIHSSKGLQFPIVYVPFGWDKSWRPDDASLTYHDDAGNRYLDVGGEHAPGRRARWAQSETENAGDDMRLLYVATTRARSHVVLWWAPTFFTKDSALHRLVFGREDAVRAADPTMARSGDTHVGTRWTPAGSVEVPADSAAVATLRSLTGGGLIDVEQAGGHGDVSFSLSTPSLAGVELEAAEFTADIDQGWRRTSYSAMTADAHAGTGTTTLPGVTSGAQAVGSVSEPDDDGWTPDEPVETVSASIDDPVDDDDRVADGIASPMNSMPFGAAFGTIVHEVLEYVDTSADDMRTHVRALCDEVATSTEIDVEALAEALCGVLTTPLGFGDLWSIAPTDRLSELDFEFPLPGASTVFDDSEHASAHGLSLADIATLLEVHLRDDDPLRAYPDRLRTITTQRFRGFLTGSIDSVLRTPDGRFVVVDYKTNRIRPGALFAHDFTTETMAEEMMAAHYPLQALLYSVALHRYLRWRMADYTPSRHLGPVQYHFVRGMVGPQTPPGCGVFEWRLPPELVVALSDLIAADPMQEKNS